MGPILAASGDEQIDLYKRLEDSITRNNSNHAYRDFSWITPQIRSELIQYAYSRSNDPSMKEIVPTKEALFWLGDTATIEEKIKAYHKTDGAQDIIGPPDILPYLVADLTSAPFENHNPLGYSPMDKSLVCCLQTIAQWPAFPAETRKWAQGLRANFGVRGIGPTAPENSLVREWWEHNKSAVLARNYADATWLPPQN